MKKRSTIATLIIIILLAGGIFIPLGSYTPTRSVCPYGKPPVKRLHLIKGETIQKVKVADVMPGPTEGCSQQFKYVLYLL